MKKLFSSIFVFLFIVQFVIANNSKIVTLTDHQYNYEFQFPLDWKLIQEPEWDEPLRAEIKSPNGSYIIVIVSELEMIQDSPLIGKDVDKLIDLLIEWTIERVYIKAFADIGADKSDIIIGKKENRSKGNTIKFFIDAAAMKDKIPVGISGLHIIPYKASHLISMIMSVGSISALKDKEELAKIMSSFHLIDQ